MYKRQEKHSLFIGEDAAENIKIKIGTASEEADLRTMEVKGRNIITGLPKVATLTSEEIRTALRETTGQIVEAVHGVLEKTPPELAADIMDRGIVLTGGCLLYTSRHLVTEIDGKPTAQLLFYNGLSYTVNQGAVSYLPNPYIEENLAFSFQLEYQAAQYYPKLYRGIYLAGLRYNLHLKPRALLLEAGAQTNTCLLYTSLFCMEISVPSEILWSEFIRQAKSPWYILIL